jgi:hypothetical protein
MAEYCKIHSSGSRQMQRRVFENLRLRRQDMTAPCERIAVHIPLYCARYRATVKVGSFEVYELHWPSRYTCVLLWAQTRCYTKLTIGHGAGN